MGRSIWVLWWAMAGCVDLADDLLDRDGDGQQTVGVGGEDCDDTDAFVNSLAEELCGDGVDNDCDGAVDDRGVGEREWYVDGDRDGFGDAAASAIACDPPELHVADNTDCDDARGDVHPEAEEVCDGIDNDCNGQIDDQGEEVASYPDLDGDGWGDPTAVVVTCTPPPQHITEGGDCDDTEPNVHPEPIQPEVWYDGVDSDCDGRDDFDQDQDGARSAAEHPTGEDCDDRDAAIGPTMPEQHYDGVDQDCDPTNEWDADHDGFDVVNAPAGGDDCDDTRNDVHPGAMEDWYDGIDQDCDFHDDFDADFDGYASDAFGSGNDCDDSAAAVYPGAPETPYDGVDSDCAGDDDCDADLDGYPSLAEGGGTDCDDFAPSIHPGGVEIFRDGIDQDCDPTTEWDADGDGFEWDGHGGTDCNDDDGSVGPGAQDDWYDGVDSDCLGNDDYDQDGDGELSELHGQGEDCDDTLSWVHPGAEDAWYDGVDADCEGDDDFDADLDGFGSLAHGAGTDCHDDVPWAFPGSGEDTPYDGIDGDCVDGPNNDADYDGYDAQAFGGDDCEDLMSWVYPGAAPEVCGNLIDDDCDGSAGACGWGAEEDAMVSGSWFSVDERAYATSVGRADSTGVVVLGVHYESSIGVYELSGLRFGLYEMQELISPTTASNAVGYSASFSAMVFCDVLGDEGNDELIVVEPGALDGAGVETGALHVFDGTRFRWGPPSDLEIQDADLSLFGHQGHWSTLLDGGHTVGRMSLVCAQASRSRDAFLYATARHPVDANTAETRSHVFSSFDGLASGDMLFDHASAAVSRRDRSAVVAGALSYDGTDEVWLLDGVSPVVSGDLLPLGGGADLNARIPDWTGSFDALPSPIRLGEDEWGTVVHDFGAVPQTTTVHAAAPHLVAGDTVIQRHDPVGVVVSGDVDGSGRALLVHETAEPGADGVVHVLPESSWGLRARRSARRDLRPSPGPWLHGVPADAGAGDLTRRIGRCVRSASPAGFLWRPAFLG